MICCFVKASCTFRGLGVFLSKSRCLLFSWFEISSVRAPTLVCGTHTRMETWVGLTCRVVEQVLFTSDARVPAFVWYCSLSLRCFSFFLAAPFFFFFFLRLQGHPRPSLVGRPVSLLSLACPQIILHTQPQCRLKDLEVQRRVQNKRNRSPARGVRHLSRAWMLLCLPGSCGRSWHGWWVGEV